MEKLNFSELDVRMLEIEQSVFDEGKTKIGVHCDFIEWSKLYQRSLEITSKTTNIISTQKEIIKDRQKQIEKLEDILKRVQAFHGCHKMYARDIATGEFYELKSTEINEALSDKDR